MQSRESFSILLVDDDPLVVRVLSHMLSDFTPLRFATSGRAALKLARESAPDLVILDVDMPGLSGFEVCKAFKSDAALAQVPIIFITSHDSTQLETLGLQLGAIDFIQKPPHAPLVLARVRTYQRMKVLADTVHTAVTMDLLTGAATRRQFEKALTLEWHRCLRSGAPLSLLLTDIDGFVAYNAACDEDEGDACLRSIAEALRPTALRATDHLGRYAGGKFALLLPETDQAGAATVAQRALDAIDALRLPQGIETGDGHVTVSVGAGYRGLSSPRVAASAVERSSARVLAGTVPQGLLAAAERALSAAKSAGGHQIRFADAASPGPAHDPAFV